MRLTKIPKFTFGMLSVPRELRVVQSLRTPGPSHFIFWNQCRKRSDPTENDSEYQWCHIQSVWDVRDMSYHSISRVVLCRIRLFLISNPFLMKYPTLETPTQREPYFIHLPRVFRNCKVQCAFPMVISPEFRMRQHRDGDHQEGAPHFTYVFLFSGVKRNWWH